MTTNVRWMKNGERGLEIFLESTRIASHGIAGFVPLAQVISTICEEILKVKAKFDDSKNHCETLIQKIRNYEKVLVEVVNLLPKEGKKEGAQFQDFLLKVVVDFTKIIEAINGRCDKWLHKGYAKQMWCASKYKDEFTMLNTKLDDCITLLSICVQLVKAENDQSAHQQLINMHKMQLAMMTKESSDLVVDLSSKFDAFFEDFRNTFSEEYNKNAARFEKELGTSIDELKKIIDKSDNNRKDEMKELNKRVLKKQQDTLDEIKEIRSEIEKEKIRREMEPKPKPNTEMNTDQFDILMKRMNRMADIIEKWHFTNANKNWWYKCSPSLETPVLASSYHSDATRKYITELDGDTTNTEVAEIRMYVTDLEVGDSHLGNVLERFTPQDRFFVSGCALIGFCALGGVPMYFASSIKIYYDMNTIAAANAKINNNDSATFSRIPSLSPFCSMTIASTALVHYSIEVRTRTGDIYTLERGAESTKKDEENLNLRSGVHFYMGERVRKRAEKKPVFATDKMKNSVTLGQLLAFCEGERTQPYSTMNNNCKHFCFKLLQNVFDEFTQLRYCDFTYWMNWFGAKSNDIKYIT